MKRVASSAKSWAAAASLVAVLATLGFTHGCDNFAPSTYVRRVESPQELVGGPGSLGKVGDWLIGNENIRVVIQDQGWSRGFGLFGGGIIDADLVRPGQRGTTDGGNGRDNFGELFPALFLQAFDVQDLRETEPNKFCAETSECSEGFTCERTQCSRDLAAVEIIEPGGADKAAILRTRAAGGDFITLVTSLLDLALPDTGLRFETDFIVRPGARHVEIVGRIVNTSGQTLDLDGGDLGTLLSNNFGIAELQLPVGEVLLFGDGNTVYAPGAVERPGQPPKPVGFDIRFSVEDSYDVPRELPALPGLVVDFLATAGPDVSYGYAAAPSERNYVWLNRDEYEKDPQVQARQDQLVVPFLIDSFTGAFQEVPPPQLNSLESWEWRRYFIIGRGDVDSVRDELYRIRGQGVGQFEGEVRNALTGDTEGGAWIHVFDEQERPFSQIQVRDDGRFKGRLEQGTYYYVVTAEGRYPHAPGDLRFSDENRFQIEAGRGIFRRIDIPPAAELAIAVRDVSGRPIPAKVSVVGHYEVSLACASCVADCQDVCAPRRYLFEFPLGEERRSTDLNWRNEQGQRNGDFVEARLFAENGFVKGTVRPSLCEEQRCLYDIYVSRGPEYSVEVLRDINLRAGVQTNLEATLARVVDTTNYISADFHVHSRGSVDSFAPPEDRVRSAAAEGLELMVSTDHNYVVDYRPTIAALNMQDWVSSVIGVELSTLEMGHFNAFPLEFEEGTAPFFPFVDFCFEEDADRVNRTAFDWVQCRPQQLFDNLRALGQFGPEETIVQVNHPRDTILGYFNQYFLNPYTGMSEEPTNANYGLVEFPFFLRPQNEATDQYNVENFSLDFDAVEVFNGKRLDQLHAFRLPIDAPTEVAEEFADICQEGHEANAPGAVLLENGGFPSFPGAVDDWLNFLNRGLRITATGNSDSHSASSEIGTPRTYFFVPPGGSAPRDVPGQVTPLDAVRGIRSGQVVATNGPFVDISVVTEGAVTGETTVWPMGSLVDYEGSNAGLDVNVVITVRRAPWVGVDQLLIYANGRVVDTLTLTDELEQIIPRTYRFGRDTYLLAEVVGSDSLFPMITPKEDPPANVGEALQGLTSALGFEGFGNNDGVRGPNFVQRVTAYAITNPVWLNIDASRDGEGNPIFNPPGTLPGVDPASEQPPFQECEPLQPIGEQGCIGIQECDPSTRRCVCPTPSALFADVEAVDQTRVIGPLLMAPPARGGVHYRPADIRKIFHGHHPH